MDIPGSMPEVVSRAAVFDFFLRSSLYSLHLTEHAELEGLRESDDFETQFDIAREVTGNQGFSPIPPSELITELPKKDIEQVLALRNTLPVHPEPAKLLSDVYEYLFTQEARRELGQFATPQHISSFLSEWAVTSADDTVLDPGVGAGMLSTAVLKEKTKKGATEPLRDIIATDIDELSVSMAAVSLKLLDGPGSPNLMAGNFLDMEPHKWSKSGRIKSNSVDAVVANPPYSRSQALSTDVKDEANRTVSGETGIDFHGKSPLYVYFLVHASQFVAENGRLAFIIPSGFMETEFGIQFKQYLLDRFQIEAILQLNGREISFKNVKTTTSLVFLQNTPPDEDHETTFIDLPEWPEVESLDELLNVDFEGFKGPEGYRVDILQCLLSPDENWLHYFTPTKIDEITGVSEFSDLATIKRGIATGNNDIFCLDNSDLEAHDIPKQYLQPIIRGAKDIPGYKIASEDWNSWREAGKDVWLLYCYDENGNKIEDPSGLEDYLEYSNAEYDTDRELFRRRNPWYCVDEREAAPILAKYMSRTGSQFIHNEAGLRTLNNFHNIYPEFEDRNDYIKALLAYLNSNIVRQEISKVSRSYSGLEKIELSALKSAPVVDPRKLDSEIVKTLAQLFDELEQVERSGGETSHPLDQIDAILKDVLNISIDRTAPDLED